MLLELVSVGTSTRNLLLVGVGLNLQPGDYSGVDTGAMVTLSELVPEAPDADAMLTAVLAGFGAECRAPRSAAELLARWQDLSVHRPGDTLSVQRQAGESPLVGTFEGLDEVGRLRLRTDAGLEIIASADLVTGGVDQGVSGRDLLLTVDAGNTNVLFGVFSLERRELLGRVRLVTIRERTADEYAALLEDRLARMGMDAGAFAGVMVGSVVPPLDPTLEEVARGVFGLTARFVDPQDFPGLVAKVKNPAEVGADRMINALAVRERFGAPAVVVDFGTATTFDVVSAAGDYVGGVIAPGLTISAEALVHRAARLPRVEVRRPDTVIGVTTRARCTACSPACTMAIRLWWLEFSIAYWMSWAVIDRQSSPREALPVCWIPTVFYSRRSTRT